MEDSTDGLGSGFCEEDTEKPIGLKRKHSFRKEQFLYNTVFFAYQQEPTRENRTA